MALLLSGLLMAADTGKTSQAQPAAAESASLVVAQDRWLSEDKFKHFGFSYAITVGAAAGVRTIADDDTSIIAGVVIGLAAGIAKEIYDDRRDGSLSWRDLVWDVAGVAAAVLLLQQTR